MAVLSDREKKKVTNIDRDGNQVDNKKIVYDTKDLNWRPGIKKH